MMQARRKDHRTLLTGCGLLGLVIVLSIFGLLVMAYNHERDVARYPGSVPLPRYNRYIARPYFIHHAAVYRTTDRPSEVENWYMSQLALRLILDEGECKTFGRTDKNLAMTQTTTVLICASLQNQVISVTRSVSLRAIN